MKLRPMVVLVMALSLSASASCGAAPNSIGIVKSIVGEAEIVRGNQRLRAAPGLQLFQGDLVQTGNGKIGLILEDDTVVSMGNDSKIVLADFAFQRKEKKVSLLVRLLRGTASFISSQVAKLAPNSTLIQTPHATIGVRGSHVLVEVD